MASTRHTTTPAAQAKLTPLDAAEQDQVLRSRLSHTLSHRPLQSLKTKISTLASSAPPPDHDRSSPAFTLQRVSLLSDIQTYLLSLSRTSLVATSAASLQMEEYERQYKEIKEEEARSIERIAALKKQLAEVRRRRKEKLEYGRLAESLEAWFKSGVGSGNGMDMEESLSNLVSHLTSSFLYNPSSGDREEEIPLSSPFASSHHSQTLALLHNKVDAMLTLSRQVREIVGWKPGSSVQVAGANTGSTNDQSGSGAIALSSAPRSRATSPVGGRSIASAALLNPNARPFEPTSATSSSNSSSSTIKRYRSKAEDLRIHLLPRSGSGSLNSAELEEGEERVVVSNVNVRSGEGEAGKRRRVDLTSSSGSASGLREEGEAEDDAALSAGLRRSGDVNDDDDDEEGSIPLPPPSAVASTTSTSAGGTEARGLPARRPLPARTTSAAVGRGQGRGGAR